MKIFEPLTVRGMDLRNRIVMPPMLVGVGYRSERARSYYGERAKGGVAAITVAGTSVDLFLSDEAWGKPGGVAAFAEGCRLLTETVHNEGAKIGVQLWYGNRYPAGAGEMDGRGAPVAPSPRDDMRALTIPEIEDIFSRFAQGFLKAREIGFDYAEIHGAHGYLFSQFFSPIDNHRTDEFGGDLAGRMRFGTECVKAVRRAVGDGYPIYFRLGAWEDRPGGITINESVTFAQELEKAGVDVLDISVGASVQPDNAAISGPRVPEGALVPYAAAIKKHVGIPVIAVGRIKTAAYAESVLMEGKADLVAIGRQMIADPFWFQKVKEGREDEIVPCISCNTCLETGLLGLGLKCAVNASVTRETEYRLKTAEKPKKVFVIGGGPAGMEASWVAAQRGHNVTLYEKKNELGGQLLAASKAPYKGEIADLIGYLSHRVSRSGVTVKLGIEATADLIEGEKPDALIIAAGAIPTVPKDIAGAKGRNVLNATDVFADIKEVGQNVAVIGGGLVGCEIAELLSHKGKKVTIIEMLDEIGSDIGPFNKPATLYYLDNAGVNMVVKTKVQEITDKGVMAIRDNATVLYEVDTVVIAVGFTPDTELMRQLSGKISALFPIGDCVESRKIVDAINDGARVGREL